MSTTTPKDPCPELTATQRALKTDQWPILDAFAQTLADFPAGEAIDCDTPDFIIEAEAGDMRLGIEIVSLRPAATADELRADVFRNVVIRAAKELFEDDIELPIRVQLPEKPLARIDDALIEAAAVSLVKRVRANVPLAASETIEVPYWKFVGTPLFELTDGLVVTRLADGEPVQWMFVREQAYALDIAAIQSAIHAKNAKAEASRRKCDALWLIVAAGYEHISSELVLDDDVIAQRYESNVDRVFVFDSFGHGLVELNMPPLPLPLSLP